jgi:peroxiredoxin
MSTRLTAGQPAPEFAAMDSRRHTLELAQLRGRPVMLSFYRYASCPRCNLRIHQLLAEWPRWREQGLAMVAVFESPAERLHRYLDRHHAPFPLVPDPERRLYRLYGVASSWRGFFIGMTHLREVLSAVVGHGFLPGAMDGEWAMLPADFLIAPDLTVADAYYGKHIGDHIPLARIDAFTHNHRGEET